MSKFALACAVMLASLFTVSVQADAAGFKRHKPHVVHYSLKRYKAHKRFRALRRFRHRYVLKHRRHRFVVKHRRHRMPHRFVRRYR